MTLPNDVQPGFHTLHLYGMNREGLLVDLYQGIVVGQDGEVVSTTGDGGTTSSTIGSSGTGLSSERGSGKGVLGAQDSTVAADVQSALAKPLQYIERLADTNGLVWVIVVAGVSTLSSLMCIILLLRKWVKPGS
jgi:hypothetical protein